MCESSRGLKNPCHGTLKMLWWLAVVRHLITTQYVDFFLQLLSVMCHLYVYFIIWCDGAPSSGAKDTQSNCFDRVCVHLTTVTTARKIQTQPATCLVECFDVVTSLLSVCAQVELRQLFLINALRSRHAPSTSQQNNVSDK